LLIEKVWGKDVHLDADNSINAAIRKVRQALKDDSERPLFVQTISGKGYRFSANVAVAPLRDFNANLSQRPAAVLFISDPDRTPELPGDPLQRCYGLTRAEVRLSMFLLEGDSLKEAANSCCVTYNTAKSQLKIIFWKTNVQRQGELIRLLLNTGGAVNSQETSRSIQGAAR
jgi:DNA-binding CsgD family transcriptional regulator